VNLDRAVLNRLIQRTVRFRAPNKLMPGCYVNCYVVGAFHLVFTPFRATCQLKSSEKSAGFELVSTYLHYG
jgi:hypothetical protein